MDADTVQVRIEHETAQLRAQFPGLTACHSALMQWREGDSRRWSLHLDLRAPQRQTLLNGPARDSAEAAIDAGFRLAKERLNER